MLSSLLSLDFKSIAGWPVLIPFLYIPDVAFSQGKQDQDQPLSNGLAFPRSNIRHLAAHTLVNPPIGCFHSSNGVDDLSDFGHFGRQIFGSKFTNFSVSATLLTLQIGQTGNKEVFDEVSRVEVAILGSQLQKPQKKERSLMRKKYGF
jgi:hypothetical protein